MSEQSLAERTNAPAQLDLPEHPDVPTWRTATRDDIDAIHSVIAAAGRVDHPTWTTPRGDIADTFELPEIDHSTDTVIGFVGEQPVAVGTAHAFADTSTKIKVGLEGAVHPDWRGRGIGKTVMRWQYDRARQIIASHETTLPGVIELYVVETNVQATTIAEDLGMHTGRWFASMVRDESEPITELDAPEGGIRIIPFAPEWAEGWVGR